MRDIELGLGSFVSFGVEVEFDLAADRRRERRKQPVVIGLRDRVELVIVAARAANRQPEHRRADRRQHVVHLVIAVLLDFVLRDLRRVNARREEPCRHHRQPVVRSELIPGDLPAHKLVVGHPGVQGLHHEVAIVEGRWPVVVMFKPVALGKPSEVQPAASPSLTVMRTGE